MFFKKMIISLFMTVMLLGSVIGTYQSSFAADPDVPPTEEQQPMDKEAKKKQRLEQTTEKIANYLDQPKEHIIQIAQEKQLSAKDLVMGAIIAKKGKRPFEEVIQEKATLGNWKAVAQKYHIAMEDVRRELHQLFPHMKKEDLLTKNPDIVLKTISQYLGKEDQEIATLWEKHPVRPFGLFHAAILSKVSGKSLDEVLTLKTKENSWREIVDQLKLDKTKIDQERKVLWGILDQQSKSVQESKAKKES
ncbi:hypothetical protein [Risungbinella massiliensis]|uniref:hypothetical protein n=1 Tax=Risungbinella massiliensis TaxID=1329796 RepID=UPI0005CC83F4|nr:hypothetical protein [Risungbinella massiliensis]